MRITVISTPIFRLGQGGTAGYSGLEHLAWLQAKGLAERGHQVSLVAPDGSECPGVRVIPAGPAGMVSEDQAWGGFSEIKDGNTVVRQAHPGYWQELLNQDVVIDNGWGKHSLLLKGEGPLKCPVLAVMHAPVNTMISSLPPNVPKPCFVCISNDQRNHFEALFNHPARTCHNGVDPDFYRYNGMARSRRFLFLARFSTIKGPDLAVEVARKCGVGLDLVGDMSITNEPEFFAKVKGMCDAAGPFKEDSIIMQGPSTRSGTVWRYSQAHAMLHPNQRFREPFGLAPVEAMQCGLPVFAFDNGAMRETVKHGETGWLSKSLDDMAANVRAFMEMGAAEIANMRERCREWAAENFSVGKMISRYEVLCQEAVDTGGW